MSEITPQNLQNFCIQTARKVITLPEISEKINGEKRPTKLIFPEYKHTKNAVTRISEQELRQCFINTLERIKFNLYYSIETPTTERFDFKNGKAKHRKVKGRSGNTDLSLYSPKNNILIHEVNIEFKHGNPPINNVKKDIIKLTNERCSGLYYFLLDSVDNSSLSEEKESGLINKIVLGLTDKYSCRTKKLHGKDKPLVISILIPKCKLLFLKTISDKDYRGENKSKYVDYLKDLLKINYKIDKGILQVLRKKNKWRVVDLSKKDVTIK